MKVQMEELSSVKRRISVEVEPAVVEKSLTKLYAKLQKEIRVPGFRDGKAPISVIENRLGDDLNKEVANHVIEDTYAEAVVEAGVTPISSPIFEPGSYSKGKPFSYKATFEIYPKFDIKGYDGLKLKRENVSVSNEEIENELKVVQAKLTQLEPVDNAKVENGMIALLDYDGKVENKAFGGKGKDGILIDVGSGNVLPDFEKQILGMAIGEKKSFTFKYPVDYFDKQLVSKEASVDVEVKDIKKKIVPAIDDELAKSLGSFKSLSELKEDIKKRILKVKEYWQKQSLHRQAMEQLVDKFKIEIPDVLIKDTILDMYKGYTNRLEYEGKKAEDGVSVSEFIVENEGEAGMRVAANLILKTIAEDEKINVTNEETEAFFNELAKEVNQPVSKVKEQFEGSDKMGDVEWKILFDKTLDFVISKAKIEKIEQKKKKE